MVNINWTRCSLLPVKGIQDSTHPITFVVFSPAFLCFFQDATWMWPKLTIGIFLPFLHIHEIKKLPLPPCVALICILRTLNHWVPQGVSTITSPHNILASIALSPVPRRARLCAVASWQLEGDSARKPCTSRGADDHPTLVIRGGKLANMKQYKKQGQVMV